MSWRDLVATGPEHRVLPWTGGRTVADGPRRWSIAGPLPAERGWTTFAVDGGRTATVVGPGEPPPGWEGGRPRRRGWLVGDRLVPDDASVPTDPAAFFAHTLPVALVPPGLPRFARIAAARVGEVWVFVGEEFPLGPEDAVIVAFTEGPPDVAEIPGVPPALELAFRFAVDERDHAAARAEAARRAREAAAAEAVDEAERMARLATLPGRLQEALRVSGATLVDHRPGVERDEVVVTFRFRDRRFECVVDGSLRIVDAGICLNDYETGEKGDTLFTLASLPAVIDEALRTDRLVVFRHPGGR